MLCAGRLLRFTLKSIQIVLRCLITRLPSSHPCQNEPTQADDSDDSNGQQSSWDLGLCLNMGVHLDLGLGGLDLDSTHSNDP